MTTKTKQKVIPTLTKVETSVKDLSLEEQLVAKRKEELTTFQKEYKSLCEKYGYSLDPVIELSGSKGIQAGFNIIPTR